MVNIFILFLLLISTSILLSTSQPIVCNGISVSYVYNTGRQIEPTLIPSNPSHQPYRFESTLLVTNNGLDKLKSWQVSLGFINNEMLVSASNAVLADGTSLPANVNGTVVLAGFPETDLKTAVETAGDISQMQARIELVGTQYGVAPPRLPMPTNLSLVNDGFLCSDSGRPNQETNVTTVCCVKDPNAPSTSDTEQDFLPRQDGDLTIMYDIITAKETEYWAQVTISNHNPLSRLDYWNLSWEWMRDEFIFSMKGAYPTVLDRNNCIYGRQGQFYKDLDFSTVLNCERTPTIIDLPVDKTNDTNLGLVPFCCRNGTVLPPYMDPARSKSAFVMQVFKMPPDMNKTRLVPPQNWKINGTFNPDYRCGPPVQVSLTLFPDPNGLNSGSSAVASWQVVCNITRIESKIPKCCVSFSAFFNDSVVPCNTCACGCKAEASNTCSATTAAVLLPPSAVYTPFENRTDLVETYAIQKRLSLPNPMPCGDNCGVSINWHLLSDFKDGWTARMTVFNWGENSFGDWFAAVELDKSMAGFEKVYSFNGSVLTGSNTTLFVQGLPDFNYIVAERDGKNPRKDPPVPGSQQSVISFTKKTMPELNVARRDGFPTKVYFNGEECVLPIMLPSNGHQMGTEAFIWSSVLALLVLVFLQRARIGVMVY